MDKSKEFIRYKIFEPFKNLMAFTTTRQSLKPGNHRYTGEHPDVYTETRKELASLIGIPEENIIFPRQTHSDFVALIEKFPKCELSDTDALVTNQSGICICVQTADCVPILLFDPVKNVISSVHAGWRGTVKKIVEMAVMKMVANFHSCPGNICAAIGPSISPAIYEVGNEVFESAKRAIPNYKLCFNKNTKHHFNLWEANRQILLKTGLVSEHIQILGECSYLEKEKYFSARRDGVETGRMASGLMLLR